MPIRPWFAAALLLGLALPPSVAARAEDEEPPKEEGADPAPAPDDAGEPVADLKKEFPKANLAWTLPAPPSEAEKPRWQWSSPGNQSLGKGDKGDLASAAFGVSDTLIAVEVSILPAMPGAVVEAFINEQSNLDNINKNFDPVPTPQTVLEMEIGNWRGGAIVATGKNASTQKPLQIRWYLVVLKGIVYVIN